MPVTPTILPHPLFPTGLRARGSTAGVALLLIAAASGCDRAGGAAGKAGKSAPPPQVEVLRVERVRRPQTIAAVGTVRAIEEAIISAEVDGVVTATMADVGDELTPGSPLAEIEPRQYELAVHEAEAALEATLAALGVVALPEDALDIDQLPLVRRAQAELANARFSHDRLEGLRSELSLADQEYSTAVRDLRVAEANLAAARDEANALLATARQRQASLDLAHRRLSDSRARTPQMPSTLSALLRSAGLPEERFPQRWVVAERHATEGQYVEVAGPLYRLIVSDVLLLRAELAQRYSGQIAVGLPVTIEAAGATVREGRVCRIYPMIDPASRTYRVDVLVENRSDAARAARGPVAGRPLTPGAFARLTITTRDTDDVIILPSAAVRSLAGVDTVFVLDPSGNTVHARQVRVVARQSGELIVEGDLPDGALVVASVSAGMSDGTVIEPVAPAQAGSTGETRAQAATPPRG